MLPLVCIVERNVFSVEGKTFDLHGNAEQFKVVTVRDNAELPVAAKAFA